MTDPETMARLLTPCAKCRTVAADPSSFYPELCPTCDDIAYGEDLTEGADLDGDGSDLDTSMED